MRKTRVAGVVLAAGEASRFRKAAGAAGPPTKLVARHDGKALVRHVAEAALGAGLAPLIVVTGHAADHVQAALAGLGAMLVHNPDFASGMASSLKAGVAAAAGADAAVILLGDMPLVSSALVAKLVGSFQENPGAIAVAPVHDGVRGNPVLLSSALFPEIMSLSGDAGARQILRGREAGVIEVVVDDAATRLDIDTPDALQNIRNP